MAIAPAAPMGTVETVGSVPTVSFWRERPTRLPTGCVVDIYSNDRDSSLCSRDEAGVLIGRYS
jgi:hypothetical protein